MKSGQLAFRYQIYLVSLFTGASSVCLAQDNTNITESTPPPRKGSFVSFTHSNIQWDQNQFAIHGSSVIFNREDPAVGVEFGISLLPGLSLGGGFLWQQWSVVSNAASPDNLAPGYANIRLYSAIARYRFNETGKIRPSLAIAGGMARFSVHTYYNDAILEGKSWQANARIEFAINSTVSLSLGATRTFLDVNDDYGNAVRNYGNFYQLAFNIHYK